MGKYFTIEELCRSDTAKRKGIDNTPTQGVVDNLNELITNVLDPVREAWGQPIYVNSGYRCKRLNSDPSIKGAKNSQHLYGEAADIDTRKGKDMNKRLFEYIRKNVEYDQLINEHDYSWVHVSFRKKNRKQTFSL